MEPKCIAYKDDGTICGSTATYVDYQRVGYVCEEHSWVTVPCTSLSCRGRKHGGPGLSTTVRVGKERSAICSECYGK